MADCHHRIVQQNELGYVSVCETCERIQVGFGTALANFTRREFSDFRERIIRERMALKSEPNPREKNIFIETSSRAWHLALTSSELSKLTDLLEKADTVLSLTSQRTTYYN